MLGFLTRFVGKSTFRPKPDKRVRLELESLEERNLPTAGITHSGAVIFIQATDKGDKVVITRNDNGTPNNQFDDSIKVQWTRGDTGQTSTSNFNMFAYQVVGDKLQPVVNVNWINFIGGAGADKVWNNTDIQSTLLGKEGNDELHGGSAADTIQGGHGSDKIYGGDGYDVMDANGTLANQGGADPSAIDYVYGGKGTDILYGGAKELNFLYGGDGWDHLYGGDFATNYLFGGDGNDVLRGGRYGAINFLYGGAGNDWMIGGFSNLGDAKTFNQMIDSKGKDTFVGGDRAFNYMHGVDGGAAGQEDVFVPAVIDSHDVIWADANDHVWDSASGPYPVSPP